MRDKLTYIQNKTLNFLRMLVDSCSLIPYPPVVDCGTPPVLLNGEKVHAEFNTTYNSTVTYRCNLPYVFPDTNAEIRITCLISGNWSEEITCCEFIGTPIV